MAKLIILLVIPIFLAGFSSVASAESAKAEAFDIALRFLFESAIETDRRQSYKWHQYTKENPKIVKRLIKKEADGSSMYALVPVYEANPLAAGTSREHFDRIIDTTKDLVNVIPQMVPDKKTSRIIYACITLIELYVVQRNNRGNRNLYGYPEIWAISYSWKF